MNDLKTYAKDDNKQAGLHTVVKKFSDDIRMEFGSENCAKASFKRGKLAETPDLQLDTHIHQRTRSGGGLQVPWNK